MFKICALTLVAACLLAAPASAAPGFDLSKLEQAAAADLQAASADATARGDTIAAQCYDGILAYGAEHPMPQLPNVVGVASAFQAGRDAVKDTERAAGNGVPQELVIACGPLALDVQNDIGKAAGFSIFGFKF